MNNKHIRPLCAVAILIVVICAVMLKCRNPSEPPAVTGISTNGVISDR